MDLKFVEFMHSARLIVEDSVKLKPGDEALVLTDTRAEDYCGVSPLLHAIIGAIQAAGAEPVVVSYTAKNSNGDELPEAVAVAMKNTPAIFSLTSRTTLHTTACREAREAGSRVLMLPAGFGLGYTNDMIYRLMPKSRQSPQGTGNRPRRGNPGLADRPNHP